MHKEDLKNNMDQASFCYISFISLGIFTQNSKKMWLLNCPAKKSNKNYTVKY